MFVTEIPLWHIRFMVQEARGADLLWEITAPSAPAVGSYLILARTLKHPTLYGPDEPRPQYRVERHEYFMATGYPPNVGYHVDVYLAPFPM